MKRSKPSDHEEQSSGGESSDAQIGHNDTFKFLHHGEEILVKYAQPDNGWIRIKPSSQEEGLFSDDFRTCTATLLISKDGKYISLRHDFLDHGLAEGVGQDFLSKAEFVNEIAQEKARIERAGGEDVKIYFGFNYDGYNSIQHDSYVENVEDFKKAYKEQCDYLEKIKSEVGAETIYNLGHETILVTTRGEIDVTLPSPLESTPPSAIEPKFGVTLNYQQGTLITRTH